MESTERFLLHPEIIAELNSAPQMNVNTLQGDANIRASKKTRAQSQKHKIVDVEEKSENQRSSDEDNESNGHGSILQDGVHHR